MFALLEIEFEIIQSSKLILLHVRAHSVYLIVNAFAI
jgi:hypothetical protein